MFSRPVHAGAVSLVLALLAITGCARKTAAHVPQPVRPAAAGSTETGIASWYGVPYHGRRAASGEIYDMEKLTAAHRTLPFNTWVEVTNLTNGKRVDVRINDRGPFVDGRIIDLSHAAARQISMLGPGIAKVRLEVILPPAIPPVAVPAEPSPNDMPARNPVPSPGAVTPQLAPQPTPISPTDRNPMNDETPESSTSPSALGDLNTADSNGGAPHPGGSNTAGPVNPESATEPDRGASDRARPSGATTNGLEKGNATPANRPGTRSSPNPVTNPSTRGTNSYTVQAGAFRDRARAEALQASLVKIFGDSRVLTTAGNPPLWRVLVGRNLSAQDAGDLAARIRRSGGDAAVVPEP